jgi:hypothetical protein
VRESRRTEALWRPGCIRKVEQLSTYGSCRHTHFRAAAITVHHRHHWQLEPDNLFLKMNLMKKPFLSCAHH